MVGGGGNGAGWSLTLCPAAFEAGGSFRYSLPPVSGHEIPQLAG